MKIKLNKLGGFQYGDRNDRARAKRADLVTLPVDGAKCENCMFFRSIEANVGHCAHVQVNLPITEIMCCSFWKNSKQINSFE